MKSELVKLDQYGELWHADGSFQVLKSKLDKIKTLNLKLEGSLRRLETSGKSVQEAVGPLAGNTQRLQVLGTSTSLSFESHHATPFDVWQISMASLER